MTFSKSAYAVATILLTLSLVVLPAFGVTIPETVPGTSDPYLAGMPSGSACCGGDSAPAESPVQVLGLALNAGDHLTFTVTGSVLNFPGSPTSSPDGSGLFGGTASNDGIASMNASLNSLVGLFLDSTQPSLTPAPAGLDFGVIGTSFTTLSPGLKQPFFIGDGLTGTGSGSTQTFVVPAGATRFFLGTVDGFGWFNNVGSFSVDVTGPGTVVGVPEPSSLSLLCFGVAGVAGFAGHLVRRKRRRP